LNIAALAQKLPSLVIKGAPIPTAGPRGLEPWDSLAFLKWLCSTPLSHGEVLAGRLILGVWNTNTDWVAEAKKAGFEAPLAAKRFDLLEAAGVWDDAHLAALRAWLEHPDFP
jgi:hypothetical protein